jgi:VanZ family protein
MCGGGRAKIPMGTHSSGRPVPRAHGSQTFGLKMFGRVAKIAAWAWVAFIVYATLVPLAMRPTLGLVGANYERFTGYVVVSMLVLLAYPRHPIKVGFFVVTAAVILEIAQLAIPDRDAQVSDAIIKSAGALVGILIAFCICKCCMADR